MPKRRTRVSTAKPTSPPPPVIAADAMLAPLRAADGGLMNLAAALNTERDKKFFSKYAPPDVDTEESLTTMWRTSWLAKRVVNTITEDMTRKGWAVNWDKAADKDQALLKRAVRKLRLKTAVAKSSRWGRLFGGTAIFMGIQGQADTSQPLEMESIKKGSLKFLRVVDRWKISPTGPVIEDINSDFFGEPEWYTLNNVQNYAGAPLIHRSRLVMFHGTELPDNTYRARGYWHDSVLTNVMEAIKNYDTATGSVASMLFESNVDILKIPGLAEKLSTEAGRKKVSERFIAAAIMKSFNHMFLIDGGHEVDPTNMSKGEEYEQKQTNFSGVNEAILRFISDVAGAADMPVTRLFGQSPAGMDATGDSDTRNYYDHISSRQEENLLPQLEYLYEVVLRSLYGSMPENVEITFNPLWQLTAKEQADLDLVRAQIDEKYIDKSVLTEHAVAKEVLKRKTYDTLTQEDVDLAEEFSEQAAEGREAALEAAQKGAGEREAAE